MRRISVSIVILLSLSLISISGAQDSSPWNVSGKVVSASDRSGIVGAAVYMINIKDSIKSRFAVASLDGEFEVKNLEKAFYKLQVSSIGHKPYTKVFRLAISEVNIGTILLEEDIRVLDEVAIEGEVVPIEQIGDTTQYNAAAFKANPDASAKDLVSKMPGIVVDSDGVTANGESIEQVLLDGKRFFGQDPLLSLNTIPAEIVDKIQVYDEESDQAQLTGFDDGNTTKTMNVVTKVDKRNGQFGKAYAGYGTNELYKIGANINSFDKDKRMTVIGMSNNINQQNFGNEDLAQVSGGRGGGRRGNGNGNFITGTQNGITKTNSIGVNFTDDWGKKATFEGSYFFNQTENSNNQLLSRESFLVDGSQYYDEEEQATTDNSNHRLNLRVGYKINDNNNLMLRSSFSYQDNQSEEFTIGQTLNESNELLNQTNNSYNSTNEAYSISNNLIYQHKFTKIGRTISLDANSSIRPTKRENYFEDFELDSLTEYLTDESQYTLGSSVTYTEPVGTSAQLALKYQINHTSRESDKDTYTSQEGSTTKSFSDVLSNHFKSGYTTQSPSIRYSNRNFGEIFDVGLTYQHAVLDNNEISPTEDQYSRKFHSVLPSVMSRMEFSGGGDIFMRYTTSTTEPSVSQLQAVIDNSDPLFLSVGNPELQQSYSHSLMIRTRKNNMDKNTSFSTSTRLQTSQEYISTATTIISADSVSAGGIVLQEGAQLSLPVNLNGYWNVQSNSTYGILLSPIKSNLNTSVGVSYKRQPGLTNEIKNVSNTYSANVKLGLASNISEKIDYNFYYQINGSRVFNTIQSGSNSQYYTQTLGAKLNLIFKKGWVFRNETSFQKYTGANSGFDTKYTLWSMGIAKKFLKNDRGEFELSVFDLLGENQSFSQNVNERYLQETQTEVLQRYFMLTFTYQLRRFKTSS